MSDPISPANPIQVRFQRQSDGSLEVYANVGRGWQHYSSLPVHFRVPDGSPQMNTPGYRTMMHLRNKFGAELLPTFEGSYCSDDEKGVSLSDALGLPQESRQDAVIKPD